MLSGPFEMFALGDMRGKEGKQNGNHGEGPTAERGTRLTPMRTQERVFQDGNSQKIRINESSLMSSD